jgi:hypothetical protein
MFRNPFRAVLFGAIVGLISMVSSQAYAVCDVAQGRVIHAETTPFDNAGATTTTYYISQSNPAPTIYYVFTTANQTFINHLNTAHAANLQVRIRGNAPSCPAARTLRPGGTILTVFRDTFF